MSDNLFEKAFKKTLKFEGGFVNDADDPGGATKYGISLRFLRKQDIYLADVDGDGDIDVADVRSLSLDRAKTLYKDCFWDRYEYGLLPEGLSGKLFDLSVNMGPRQAHRCLQRALRACFCLVMEDGICGVQTRAAATAVDNNVLLPALRSEAAGFYRSLAAQKPSLSKYLKGWLRRAYS